MDEEDIRAAADYGHARCNLQKQLPRKNPNASRNEKNSLQIAHALLPGTKAKMQRWKARANRNPTVPLNRPHCLSLAATVRIVAREPILKSAVGCADSAVKKARSRHYAASNRAQSTAAA